MSEWHVITADSLEYMRCGPPTFDAIVTSPPYADQRAGSLGGYTGGAARVNERANRNAREPGTKNQSRRQRSEAPMRFAREFRPFIDAMAAVLAPTGSLMLNLGVILRDGEESPYADEILAYARSTGWKLLHRIVWHKPNGNVLSDARFLTLSHEWVFWLARSTDAYRGYDRDTRRSHNPDRLRRIEQAYKTDPDDERYVKRTGGPHALHPDGARPSTVFSAGVGGRVNGKGTKHSATMPLALAAHLVSLACPPGGTVLDPFCGAGTTGMACRRRGRQFVGVEIVPEHAQEARERIHDDAPLLDAAGPPEDAQAALL